MLSILGLIADADEPILWRDLVDTYHDTARRPDTRALKMTPLGVAWP